MSRKAFVEIKPNGKARVHLCSEPLNLKRLRTILDECDVYAALPTIFEKEYCIIFNPHSKDYEYPRNPAAIAANIHRVEIHGSTVILKPDTAHIFAGIDVGIALKIKKFFDAMLEVNKHEEN